MDVAGVLGELGGEDNLALGDRCLGVVALQVAGVAFHDP